MKFSISNKTGDVVSQELIGLFFEDINFAADGGLYAEMIENRSFEAQEAFGTPGYFYAVDDNGYAWSSYAAQEGKEPRLQFVTGDPLSAANPHYLHFTAVNAGDGFKNKAYDGILLKKGMSYKVSFYARCVRYKGDGFTVRIEKDGKVYAESKIKAVHALPYLPFTDLPAYGESKEVDFEELSKFMDVSEFMEIAEELALVEQGKGTKARKNEWIHYETVLTAEDDVRFADFIICLDQGGCVDFDLISMIPEDAVAGLFRRDLFDALKAIKPGFIRFPGGCIVEGISLYNRYQWKKTLGPQKDRKVIPCLWAFQDERKFAADLDAQRSDAHYMQSYGIGYYEYFVLCEMLGAKPLPVLNIGAACQFRTTEFVPIDAPEFQEYVQDALDLIEFANGPVDSKWGAIRAQMGHPEPFGLDMVAIGNEQWETRFLDLERRYEIFEKAIHDVYPEMRTLGTDGPIVGNDSALAAWEYYRNGENKKQGFSYAVDEHFYVSPEWLYERIDMYDDYPRSVGVFAGEYACHTADKENDLEAALAEAAFLTGIEKNASVVKLASYAPLFNRVGHSQWKPDMIWFDDQAVYLTPSYQVQMLYGSNLGAYTVPMDGQEKALREKQIYVSVSKTAEGQYILKAVNSSEEDAELELTALGADGEAALKVDTALFKVLRSAGQKPENMPEPTVIDQFEAAVDGKVVLKAKTFSVIRF